MFIFQFLISVILNKWPISVTTLLFFFLHSPKLISVQNGFSLSRSLWYKHWFKYREYQVFPNMGTVLCYKSKTKISIYTSSDAVIFKLKTPIPSIGVCFKYDKYVWTWASVSISGADFTKTIVAGAWTCWQIRYGCDRFYQSGHFDK